MTEGLSAELIEGLLSNGSVEVMGLLPGASNYTFACKVREGAHTFFAVYKPQRGETPLWDFPPGTLYQREVAAYLVSRGLGWDLVPPTVVREAEHGVGSLQLFIHHDPEHHYLTMMPGRADEFRRTAAFDAVINNADRKSGHCLLEDGTDRVWLVDHGVSFHAEPKLRTVIWDFAGEPLPPDILGGLEGLRRWLDADGDARLGELLDAAESQAVGARLEELIAAGTFPDPPLDRRPYPWPPI